MKIGEILKEERKERSLTQEQFVKGILSSAHYSKVERGLHEISVNDLLKILTKNKINYADFFNKIDQNNKSDSNNKLEDELDLAYDNRDIDTVRKINRQLQNLSDDNLLKLHAKFCLSILESKGYVIREDKDVIISKLFAGKHWLKDNAKLNLLANFVFAFSPTDVPFFFNQVYQAYHENLAEQSAETQGSIAALCTNCLYIFYENNIHECRNKAIFLLLNLTESPELAIDKIIGYYYQVYFAGEKEKVKEIRKLLQDSHLTKLMQILPQ